MTNPKYLLPTCFMAAFCLSCSHPTPVEKAEPKPAAESTASASMSPMKPRVT